MASTEELQEYVANKGTQTPLAQ